MNAPPFLRTAIERAMNMWLAAAPGSRALLPRLQDVTVAVDIVELDLTFLFRSDGETMHALAESVEPPAAHVRGSLLALASSALAGVDLPAGLEISGDATVGQAFARLLREARIDWEEILSRGIGDIAAHQFGNLVRSARDLTRTARATLAVDVAEYLQYETRQLPPRREVRDFLDGVDTVRTELDRLEARLRRLEQRRGNRP